MMSHDSLSNNVTKTVAASKISRPSINQSSRIHLAPDVTWARTGDHQAIHKFLLAVFQGPTREDFQGSLEEPLYEPTDRLLIKRRNQIVGHVHLRKRMMHFGHLRLPTTRLQHLATSPEYRGYGYARQLLAAADSQIEEDGAAIAFLTTKTPTFFENDGWVACSQEIYSQASPRDIRACLSVPHSKQRKRKLNIRHWRHVELGALMRLFRENTAQSYGPIDRSEDYWHWLMMRRAFEHIFIAIAGPDKLQLDDENRSIVGYAITKRNNIVEMMTANNDPKIAMQLLNRVTGDAIERDLHSVVFHAPLDHPLHDVMITAGGTINHQSSTNNIHMVKIKDPFRFLELICDELHQRAKDADLPRPCEIGLSVERNHYQLVMTNRSIKLLPGKTRRNHLQCTKNQFVKMLVGNLDLQQEIATGAIKVSSQTAQSVLGTLFPYQPLWIPPFDQLEA